RSAGNRGREDHPQAAIRRIAAVFQYPEGRHVAGRTSCRAARVRPGALRSDDPRVTGVGKIIRKLRFDELPQFFNTLKGDMSLVGPRPERPEFVQELSDRTIRG